MSNECFDAGEFPFNATDLPLLFLLKGVANAKLLLGNILETMLLKQLFCPSTVILFSEPQFLSDYVHRIQV